MINRVWLAFGAFVVVAVGVVAFVSLNGGTSGGPSQRLRSWVTSSTLGQDIGTLEDDGTSMRKALSRHRSLTSVHTACAAMANDAETDNGKLPSPDTKVTQLLARAYGLEYDAAESCYRADSPGASLFTVARRDQGRAADLFGEVLRRVRVVTGRTVPTTTTTVPDLTGTALF